MPCLLPANPLKQIYFFKIVNALSGFISNKESTCCNIGLEEWWLQANKQTASKLTKFKYIINERIVILSFSFLRTKIAKCLYNLIYKHLLKKHYANSVTHSYSILLFIRYLRCATICASLLPKHKAMAKGDKSANCRHSKRTSSSFNLGYRVCSCSM